MNLVEQIFEQAKLGTAPDPNANPFAEGMRMGLQQQQIDAEKQRLAMEIAQMPLKQTLLQQSAQMNALKIEQGLKAKQDDIDATGAFTGLASTVTDKLKNGQLDDAIIEFTKGGLNNNVLLADPRYQALGKQLDEMDKEAKLAEYRKGIVEARKEAARTSQFRALPPVAKLNAQLEEAQANLQDAQDAGDQELAARYQQQVDFFTGQIKLGADTLAVRQGELKAREARTAAINARTQELSQRLNSLDRVAMASELKLVDDQPNSKMDYKTKVAAKQAIHEKYEAKAKAQTAPGGGAAPSGIAAPPPPPVSTGEDRAYILKDGKTYWVPRDELPKYLAPGTGYSLKPD